MGSTQNSFSLMPMIFLFSSLCGEEQMTLFGSVWALQEHSHGFLLKLSFVFTRLIVATKRGQRLQPIAIKKNLRNICQVLPQFKVNGI